MTTPLNVAQCLANTIPEQPTPGQLPAPPEGSPSGA